MQAAERVGGGRVEPALTREAEHTAERGRGLGRGGGGRVPHVSRVCERESQQVTIRLGQVGSARLVSR